MLKILKKLLDRLHKRYRTNYHNFPFGETPRGSKEEYERIWSQAKQKIYPVIDNYENKLQSKIDSNWFHELALHTQVVIKSSEICYQHGRLLYTFVTDYLNRNDLNYINILETGTARGFSCLCMAKALHDRDVEGKIITFDLLPHDVKMYWNCIDDLESPKSRKELLSNYSDLIERYVIFCEGDTRLMQEKIDMSRINFAFIDASHTFEDVVSEFSYINERQRQGDNILFDDYQPNYFPGVVKAVDTICDKYGYLLETIRVSDQRGYAIAYKV
jgi:predicted O-methyltransferase YrrM|tara:strand:- start:608 stop:1426 length:819 start_codon:yes stop_codon:yes gene_type:complete